MEKKRIVGEEKQVCSSFLKSIENNMGSFIEEMQMEEIEKAAEIILDAESNGRRVHISGIGKPAHLAGYIASLFSSTGIPAYFLHGTEAVHGSCGQMCPGDILIFISNSGETEEMKAAVSAAKRNQVRMIGVSGSRESWLAGQSEVHLYAGVPSEGGPLNRAPRSSVLAEMIVLQTLSVYLQAHAGITPEQYVRWHPGGTLGKLRDEERGGEREVC